MPHTFYVVFMLKQVMTDPTLRSLTIIASGNKGIEHVRNNVPTQSLDGF